jgi:HAE1 family hydrophobic/amphiphilic exporter-1
MLDLIFRKQVGVLLLFLLLCTLGIILVTQLPVQLYPQTNRPSLRTTIRHDGYSAVSFSQEFGDMVESILLAVEGVDLLEARYGSNQSTFTLTFNWEVEAAKAKLDAEAAVDSIQSRLPSNLQGVSRVQFSTGENAGYLIIGVGSQTSSPEDLYRVLKTSVESQLQSIADADLVEIFNVEDLRVSVILRPQDMLNYGITIADVNTAMRSNSTSQSVGNLTEGSIRYNVRFAREPISLMDIGKIVIRETGTVRVLLEDVADIDIAYTVPSATFVMEGARGIQVSVSPMDGGNIRSMSQEVNRVLREARDSGILPEDTEFNLLLDPAAYIDRSISSVVQAALLGALLAMIVVFLALGEVRNTLLIGVSLPVTMILSFPLLYIFDVSLNLISLGGMALAVGMIVDSSIVVMENIHRFRADENYDGDRNHLKDLIKRSVKQMQSPIIASTLTSILVFLPISFTAPLTNAILGEQSQVVVYTLVFSLIVALTLIPLLAYIVYQHPGKKRLAMTLSVSQDQELGIVKKSGGALVLANISMGIFDFLEKTYTRVLRLVVSRKQTSIILLVVSVGLLLFSVTVILPRIPTELLSPPSSDRLIVFIQPAQETTTQAIVEEKLPEMTQIIQDNLGDYVVNTYAEVRGRFNRLFVVLKNTNQVQFVTEELQRLFTSDNDWYYNIFNWDPAQLPLPRTNDLQISVYGPDETQSIALLERIRDLLNQEALYSWVTTVPTTNFADELILSPRSETLGRIQGFTETGLLSLIQRILVGTQTVEFEHEGLMVNVQARYADDLITSRVSFENFLFPFDQTAVPLKHFFDFSTTTGVSQIATENGESIFRVYGTMTRGTAASERPLREARTIEYLETMLEIPEGYTVAFENPQEELDSAIQSLFISLAISVALIYLLLAFQYNSLLVPLIILVSVPLGFIGLVFSLFVFNSTLSLNSLLGAILLSGIVVNNAIIFIDFYQNSLDKFENRIDALVSTAGVRFRPILITSLTTVVGMLPIAIGLGEGSNVIKPLGIAVSGGLFVSTLLTLFVVPAILNLVHLKKPIE